MNSLILHGRKQLNSQKWRNLSSSPSFSSLTVSYLVDSLSLTPKLAESISRKVSFENKTNFDSVLNLLRSHGFSDSQISTIITIYPRLLTQDAEKSLSPKLQCLQSKGASSSELTEIISKVPKILGKRGNKSVIRYYDFVKGIVESDKSSNFEGLCQSLPLENKFRNISVLRELGVAQRLLFPLLISDSQPVCGKERFEESLKKVVELGFDPATPKFVEALRVVYRMSDKTIEEKVDAYKRLGFDVWAIFKKWPSFLSYSEKKTMQTLETLKRCGLLKHEVLSVLKKHPKCICSSEQKILNSIDTFTELGFIRDDFTTMVKRYPQCIDYTTETVKKKTEFLVKTMKWPLYALVQIPQVFGYSLEKRIVPRCNVIKTLMLKGLVRNGSETPPMSSVLTSSNKVFLSRYVMKYDEFVPELMAIFTGDRVL